MVNILCLKIIFTELVNVDYLFELVCLLIEQSVES